LLTALDLLNIIEDMARCKEPTVKIASIYESLKPVVNGGMTPDIEYKVAQMMLGNTEKERNVTQEVFEWIALQDGIMNVGTCYNDLKIVTAQEKAAIRKAFQRYTGDNLIERYGEKSGTYRKIQAGQDEQKWWEATGKPLPLQFPLQLERAKIYPGNIILLQGAKSSGKTRWALNFLRLNRRHFDGRARYQNVEMGDDEIQQRALAFEEDRVWSVSEFRREVEMMRITNGWWDYILPDGLNVVDYLIEYEEAYKIANYIFKIHEKLKKGIALVIVQKDPRKFYGMGGYSIQNIPRLILSLQNHTIKIEDVKAFTMNEPDDRNPSGMVRSYTMPGLWKFVPSSDWHYEEEDIKREKEKKYSPFIHEE
jgi:hypothetical protein